MEKVRYMISDAATMAGVESHVLRYWEDELDLTIPRNEMGHRYYTRENILEFQRIKSLKEQGYQLKAIRTILHNGGDVPPPLVTVMNPPSGESAQAENPPSGHASQTASRSDNPASLAANLSGSPASQAENPPSGQVSQTANLSGSHATQTANPLTVQTAPAVDSATDLDGKTSTSPAKTKPVSAKNKPSLVPAVPQEPVSVLSAEDRMEQFRELMSDIVGRAISQNNEELSLNISQEVHATVLKEMNYLFREQEDAEEERFKKLDAAIRGSLRRKRSLFAREDKPKKEKPPKASKTGRAAKQKTTASPT